MKFFTASLLLLLGSAILEGSFATPAQKNHKLLSGVIGGVLGTAGHAVGGVLDTAGHAVGGVLDVTGHLVGGVLDLTGNLLGNLDELLHQTVANISAVLRKALSGLPELTDKAIGIVDQLLHGTGKGLVCAVKDVVGNVLYFSANATGHHLNISLNLDTLEVCVNGKPFGELRGDGAIVDLKGAVCGLVNKINGVLVFAGDLVDKLPGIVDGILDNFLQEAGHSLGNLLVAVHNALVNISDALRQIVKALPCATAEVLRHLEEVFKQTGEVVLCTAKNLVGNVINYVVHLADGFVTININLETLEVCIGDKVIATIEEDGSIVDPQGNVCGCVASNGELLIFAGDSVHAFLHNWFNEHFDQGEYSGEGNLHTSSSEEA